MKPPLLSAGFWCTAALTLGGLWLLLAPAIVRAAADGAGWAATRTNDVATGAVLAAAGFAGMFAQLAFGLRDLAWDAAASPEETAGPEAPPRSGGM